jgi:hypothetical protein
MGRTVDLAGKTPNDKTKIQFMPEIEAMRNRFI